MSAIRFCSTRQLLWVLLHYLPSFKSIAYLLHLLWLFEVFYRNQTSPIFKMADVPANFIFQIGSIVKNVLHDVYYYVLCKISCFYHILNYFSQIAWTTSRESIFVLVKLKVHVPAVSLYCISDLITVKRTKYVLCLY